MKMMQTAMSKAELHVGDLRKGYWMAMGALIALGRSIASLIVVFCVVVFFVNLFGIGTDDTDDGGWHRSGVVLITDHGTGVQYLYRGGALIRRETK